MITEADRRYMREAVDFSRQHLGRTASNPAVGTIIVKDGTVVGRGVTALGGRPHAEAQALSEAGEAAKGATAYVTLEPCAHHGRTPPCADALVNAGIARLFCALSDPDERVAGKGFAILKQAGVEVIDNVEPDYAKTVLWAYLIRAEHKRCGVTLKLAISTDGMLGVKGQGNVAITGEETRAMVHRERAESDMIMVGIGTVLADDPMLDVRLAGMEDRSPHRIIVDRDAQLPLNSRLVQTARQTPVSIVTCDPAGERAEALRENGVQIIAGAQYEGKIALPELLEDLAATGAQSLFVEGGAQLAQSFLDEDLVDRLLLVQSPKSIGAAGLPSPIVPQSVPASFAQRGHERYGDDDAYFYLRKR